MLLKLRGHGWGPWPFVDSWNVGVSKEVLAEVLKIKIVLGWKCTIGIVTWRENKSIEPVGIMLMVKKLAPSVEVWTQPLSIILEWNSTSLSSS